MEMENAESAIGKAMVKDTFGAPPYRTDVDDKGSPITPPLAEVGAGATAEKSIVEILVGDAVKANEDSARREDGE